ncbi:MAG: thioredoxin family protein [Pseudomonadota bacterium]
MNRRAFILTSTALVVIAGHAAAGGAGFVDFDASDPITAALDEGKTVLVDYAADWCSTCARQERIITALRAANPAYDENIVFIRVDWDDFGNAPVTTSRNIPRRSTLIVLRGDDELGRLVAGTREGDIQALMDRALQAATGA